MFFFALSTFQTIRQFELTVIQNFALVPPATLSYGEPTVIIYIYMVYAVRLQRYFRWKTNINILRRRRHHRRPRRGFRYIVTSSGRHWQMYRRKSCISQCSGISERRKYDRAGEYCTSRRTPRGKMTNSRRRRCGPTTSIIHPSASRRYVVAH